MTRVVDGQGWRTAASESGEAAAAVALMVSVLAVVLSRTAVMVSITMGRASVSMHTAGRAAPA